MSRELRGIKGKDAIKAFLRAGGIENKRNKRNQRNHRNEITRLADSTVFFLHNL